MAMSQLVDSFCHNEITPRPWISSLDIGPARLQVK
jgi:hypothetical protein